MPVSPACPCSSYEPGHAVNPIAALHWANNPAYAAADRPGWVMRIQRELIIVAFDGGTVGRFRNHDTVRLGGLTIDHGPRVAYCPSHGLLRLEHEDGTAMFNVALDTDQPLGACGLPAAGPCLPQPR